MTEALNKLHEVVGMLKRSLICGDIYITMHREREEWYYKLLINYKLDGMTQTYAITEDECLKQTTKEIYNQVIRYLKYDITSRYFR